VDLVLPLLTNGSVRYRSLCSNLNSAYAPLGSKTLLLSVRPKDIPLV